MAINNVDPNQLVSAYQSGDTAGLQSLVNQYGITSADVQSMFPGFDVAAQAPGITLAELSPRQQTPMRPSQEAFGSISNAVQNLVQSGQAAPSSFDGASFSTQPTYGTAGDISAYDADQFIKANIDNPQAIKDAMARTGITQQDLERMYAGTEYTPGVISNYLGTPETMYGTGDRQVNTQQALDFILANLDDPTKIYQAGQSIGLKPEDYFNILQGTEYANLDTINQYLGQGQQGFGQRFEDIVGNVFGTGDQRTAFEQQIGGRELSDIFQSDKYSKMSLEDIEAELGASDLNKYQSAVDTARFAQHLFGADEKTQQQILTDIMSGKVENPLVEKAYKDLLAGNTLTKETQDELLREAAKANPQAPVFQNNPELYAVYSPLGETKEGANLAGQYGYYNNAPILNASEVDKALSGKNLTVDFRSGRTDDNAMGWDLHSRDAGRIANGVAVFGVTSDKNQAKAYAELENSLADLGQVRYVEPSGDESGYYVAEKVKTDSEGNQYVDRELINTPEYERYLDEQEKLTNAAAKLGVDPAQYDNFADLYDAVQDKSKDLYAITGRTVGWDPSVAENVGIQTLTADAGDMNHAYVLYKRSGDKLLAIDDPNVFTANDKQRSGFAAQVAPWAPLIAIATLPFGGVGGALTQGLGALAGTTLPTYMTALANAAYSTAMGGGDFNDFGRTLLTQGVTDLLGAQFGEFLGPLVQDGTISPDLAKALAQTGAGALTTAAREGDVTGYLKNAGLNYAFNEALSKAGPALGFDTKSMSATDKVILSSLMPAVLRGQMSDKDLINMLGKAATAKNKE